jgi:probable phosphoglycerate mutase
VEVERLSPGWVIFEDGCPGGESPEQVGARVDRVIEQARTASGRVALFAHGHVFRVLAARWLGLPPTHGRHFLLNTSTLSILGYYRGIPAIRQWNAPLDERRLIW